MLISRHTADQPLIAGHPRMYIHSLWAMEFRFSIRRCAFGRSAPAAAVLPASEHSIRPVFHSSAASMSQHCPIVESTAAYFVHCQYAQVYRLLIQAPVANSPLSRTVQAQNGNCLAKLHPLLFDYERPSWPSSDFVLAATGDGLKGDHSDSSSFHPPLFPPLSFLL